MMPVLICLASLFVHILLLAIQHGFAPLDSDGDGVQDTEDRCPFSSAHLHFCSSWRNDWDGDGCLDAEEDSDDDDDAVPDWKDLCPRTVLGAAVDSEGCTPGQRELQMRSGIEAEQARAGSIWSSMVSMVSEAGLEVLLGA